MSSAAAFRIHGRPCSEAEFYAHACDPARSVVVEACAGAGKTWMLVSRIVRALLAGAQPQEILAITFTRKATGEVRQRLQQWLGDWADCSAEERVEELTRRGLGADQAFALQADLATLGERVLAAADSVQVQTFHAWFARLMRAAPYELLSSLGLHPGMELVEDIGPWQAALMRRFHGQVAASPPALADFNALVREHGRRRIADWLAGAMGKRIEIELADAAGALEAAVPPAQALWPDDPAAAAAMQALRADAALRRTLEVAARELGVHKGVKAREAAQALSEALDQTDGRAAFDQAWAALFTRDDSPRKLPESPALGEALAALERLAEMREQQQASEDHARMARLSRLLFACWREIKRAHALADMADLEHCAWRLLGDPVLSAQLAQRLDAQLRHLLIDEFQDTSPLQWHALAAWLSGYAGAGGGARPPALFIVGDPKQSIYRFRGAEPKVFAAARDFVTEALGGELLECDHTRRNSPAVLAPLNQVFAVEPGYRLHTSARPADAADAVRLLPDPPEPEKPQRADNDASTWRDSLDAARRQAEAGRRRGQMRRLAAAIGELMGRHGVEPREIMVLARKRDTLADAAEALRERQIPCLMPEQARVTDMPEAQDLIALLEAIASNGNNLALAQALKCPLFGLGDQDLLDLAQRAERGSLCWWDAFMAWTDAPAAAARAQALLAQWSDAARRLPPHDLLDRIVAEGQALERFVAAAPPARRQLAALGVRSLLEQALSLDGARYATPYGFVRALRSRAPQRKAGAKADAVQLLTVHGAKGLEARAVFIVDADPNQVSRHEPGVLVDWPVQSPQPRGAAFVVRLDRVPKSLRALHAAEAAAAQREESNALYVAMTRAEQWLVLSRTPARRPVANSWWTRIESLGLPVWEVAVQGAALVAPVEAELQVPQLPRLARPLAPPACAPAAIDDAGARHGRALHRVLEWAGTMLPPHDWSALADAAVREAGAAPEAAHAIAATAQRILGQAELAPLFDPSRLAWAGNEVTLGAGSQWLRVDRLVQLKPEPGAARSTWWVLDYKLALRPEEVPAYQAQLARYRMLVQALEPHARVRAGFITADARLVELPEAVR